jgi:hypothetical protein
MNSPSASSRMIGFLPYATEEQLSYIVQLVELERAYRRKRCSVASDLSTPPAPGFPARSSVLRADPHVTLAPGNDYSARHEAFGPRV